MKKIVTLLLILNTLPCFALTLSSNDITNGGAIPVLFTCDGQDISPTLEWSHLPDNTKSLTLILSDPDAPAGPFYHWVVFNIPKTASSIKSKIPPGSIVGKNSWGTSFYRGPCPPKGATHHYLFNLYAVDTKLNLSSQADGKSVMDALQSHIVDKAELKASFGH